MALSKRNQIPFADLSFVEFVEGPLDERLICPICSSPLNDPVQTACGHRLCFACFKDSTSKPNAKCPLDGEPLGDGAFHDVCCRREIASLSCFCLFKKHGCTWEKELMYLKDHLDHCEYKEVPCHNNGCKEMIPKIQLDKHMIDTCQYKPSKCQHCGQHVPEVQMEAHLRICPKFPMDCDQCGTTNISRNEMEQHLESACPQSEKPCKFSYAGCGFKAKDDAMDDHYQTQKSEHLNLMLDFSRKKDLKENELAKRLENIEQENSSLQEEMSSHRESLAEAYQDLRTYQTRLGKVEQTVADHRRDIAQMRERMPESTTGACGKDSLALDEFRTALADQEVKLSSLEAELSRGSLSSSSLGPSSLFSGSVDFGRRLGRNEHQLALHDIQLAEHDLKIQMLEVTSYDGTFTWRIEDFSRRHHEAVTGKTPSIYSPPFYVGRFGYKVCARVYPNGDGLGKGSHLSLFFVIMKGDYDALLPWPFRQKVTFKLLDQERQNDIQDTFRPDPNSSSFKRPTSSMNIASGCPMFVPQVNLQKKCYVNDDVLFLQVIVDKTGLPTLGLE